MQFNSYIFILVFLPIFVIGYWCLNRINAIWSKIYIIVAGIVFYMYGAREMAVIFLLSVLFNLIMSIIIHRAEKYKKVILAADLILNILLLFYFKYFNFTIDAVNKICDTSFNIVTILLPLGISFFTFQQIMYVVSIYKGEIERVNIVDYLVYILYFPKLIMGPLIEPKEFISQLNGGENSRKIQWNNVASGMKMFSYGLFKKMIFADTFSKAVAWGFGNIEAATSGDLFLVMLCYTFEIYFDFSGYTDMAVGVSNMINIKLPMNFDSPYKAYSIRDFWKRWHMSLTNFLTKYVYFPLGGSKKGNLRTYINILIVFLVSGLWHGANYTFILWGVLHGILQIVERVFGKAYSKLFDVVKWCYTFLAINILWLLFRCESISMWILSLKKMFSFQDMSISAGLINTFNLPEKTFVLDVLHLTSANAEVWGFSMLLFIVMAYIICLVPENNYRTMKKLTLTNMALSIVLFVWAFLCLSSESVFVYFNF